MSALWDTVSISLVKINTHALTIILLWLNAGLLFFTHVFSERFQRCLFGQIYNHIHRPGFPFNLKFIIVNDEALYFSQVTTVKKQITQSAPKSDFRELMSSARCVFIFTCSVDVEIFIEKNAFWCLVFERQIFCGCDGQGIYIAQSVHTAVSNILNV